jgi:hypothetical protein
MDQPPDPEWDNNSIIPMLATLSGAMLASGDGWYWSGQGRKPPLAECSLICRADRETSLTKDEAKWIIANIAELPRPYSSNEESAARYLHVFGLDQLDLLGDRPCAYRFWFQSPRYLRAMAFLENAQKAGQGDSGIDTAPPNRNRALKQGECRRGFKVSLAPIEHPRFGQMRLICAKSL